MGAIGWIFLVIPISSFIRLIRHLFKLYHNILE